MFGDNKTGIQIEINTQTLLYKKVHPMKTTAITGLVSPKEQQAIRLVNADCIEAHRLGQIDGYTHSQKPVSAIPICHVAQRGPKRQSSY